MTLILQWHGLPSNCILANFNVQCTLYDVHMFNSSITVTIDTMQTLLSFFSIKVLYLSTSLQNNSSLTWKKKKKQVLIDRL